MKHLLAQVRTMNMRALDRELIANPGGEAWRMNSSNPIADATTMIVVGYWSEVWRGETRPGHGKRNGCTHAAARIRRMLRGQRTV